MSRREETRRKLLDAARRLLVERGFHGVALEDIASAAGVSRQAVYKSHFSSKSDLLLALLRHVHETQVVTLIPTTQAKTALEALEQRIRVAVRIEARIHDIALMLNAARTSDPGADQAWRDRTEVKRLALGAAVVQLEQERRLSADWTVREAVDLLTTLLSCDAYQLLVVERGWSQDTFVRRVYDLFAGTLLVEPPAKRSSRRQRSRRK